MIKNWRADGIWHINSAAAAGWVGFFFLPHKIFTILNSRKLPTTRREDCWTDLHSNKRRRRRRGSDLICGDGNLQTHNSLGPGGNFNLCSKSLELRLPLKLHHVPSSVCSWFFTTSLFEEDNLGNMWFNQGLRSSWGFSHFSDSSA